MNDIIQTAKDFGIDVQWAISRRKQYLNEQISRLQKESNEVIQLFSGKSELDRYLLLDTLKWINNQAKRFETELHFKRGSQSRISQDMINLARQYPIENLLRNIKNGKVNCINHQDERPSMDIRNNFAYCYSCGWHGDSIAVYRKLNSSDFASAVRALIRL
jgi:hypothetical protein